jgi:hypothetical protein
MITPYNNLDEALSDYVWKGEDRYAITKVIKYQDKTASTDAHNLLLINSNLVENKGIIVEGYPNIARVLDEFKNAALLPFKFDCDRIVRVLESTEKEKEYLWEECDTCGGSGFSLNDTDEHCCVVCKGDGEVATDEVISESYSITNLFLIGTSTVQFNYVEKFLKLYQLVTNVKVYQCKDAIKITFDEGELYIMMVQTRDNCTYNIVDLN